jgi:predicted alpha/beta superfamily hydrolase
MIIPLQIPGMEVQSIHSAILDRDLQLFIKLPWSYERSDKAYPVLYTTDANRNFPIYATTSLIYETPGPKTPEILIVGIGYCLDAMRLKGLAQWAIWRTHDLTPISRPETDQWWSERLSALLQGETVEVHTGGAEKFLSAISDEIIPFIEANYRAESTDRGLAGYSDGGLFTLYTLFHKPELFKRYFAGSPSMWDQLILDEEAYTASHTDLPAKLLVTAGEKEVKLLEKLSPFIKKLQSRGYPRLALQFKIYEDEGHASAMPGAISRALCVLYNPSWLNK